MVVLNSAYIMLATTKKEFRSALAQVQSTMRHPDTSNGKDMEESFFHKAFERHIQRLLRTSSHGLPKDNHDAKDIIAFVRDAARPLRVKELLYMLALRSSAKEIDEDDLRAREVIPTITEGLVDIGEGDLLDFVHPGLRHHLECDSSRRSFPDSNFSLAKLCFKYLNSPRFSTGACASKSDLKKRMDGAPFWVYAAENLHKHYKASANHPEATRLKESILKFLKRDGSIACALQLIHSIGKEATDPKLAIQLATEDELKTPLVLAGDLSITKWLEHRELAWWNAQSSTGIHLAISLKLDIIAIELLKEQGSASLSQPIGLGETPLHLAVICSGYEMVDELILRGADLNASNTEGMSPWHIAAATGNLKAVTTMLAQAPGRLAVNARMRSNEPRWEAETRDASGLPQDQCSTWTNRTVSGYTALHYAARAGYIEVVSQILADGRSDWTIEDDDGMTAYHKACKHGRLQVVRLFEGAFHGCSQRRSLKDGRTGLHLACKYAAGIEVVKHLLGKSPGLCDVKDDNGELPLHHAATSRNIRAVSLLLQHAHAKRADVYTPNRKGQTPLDLAARGSDTTCHDIMTQHVEATSKKR